MAGIDNQIYMDDIVRKYSLWIEHEGIFDLQLFAAEDDGRTEEPTEKKIREAREKGQVAKSEELPQALVVICGICAVLIFSSWFYDSMIAMVKYYLSSFSGLQITAKSVRLELFKLLTEVGLIISPVLIAVVFAGIAGNVSQVGFQFSSHPLKMDWSKIKLDPATIMKKIFFSKQVGMNLFKSLFKVIAIGVVAYMIILGDFDQLLALPDISIPMALKLILMTGFKIILWSTMLLLVLSVPDYYFQKREFVESLKMTKQEIKEEWKETSGDPHMKARLREMQREILMRNMISEVPMADVIITNPTHYAVALKYEKETMTAPTVIAKGVDNMALKIREIARENGIEIFENKALARELYSRLEVGDIIPDELFQAVILIYAKFYKNKNFQEAV